MESKNQKDKMLGEAEKKMADYREEIYQEEISDIIESLKFMFSSKTSAVSLLEVKNGDYIYIHTNDVQKK